MKGRLKVQCGQTLVESVFVIGVVALTLTAFVAGVIYFIRVSDSAKKRSIAVTLAREKMEQLQADRDNEATAFWSLAAGYTGTCEEEETASEETGLAGLGVVSKRTSRFCNYSQEGVSKKITVMVEVFWSERSNYDKKVTVTNSFTDYRQPVLP